MRPAAYIIVPIIYIIFTLTSIVAGFVGLLSLLTGSGSHISRIMHAMNVLAAAQLGIIFPSWSGRDTVSKECGRRETKCKFCKWLCKVLAWADKDHCAKEAA